MLLECSEQEGKDAKPSAVLDKISPKRKQPTSLSPRPLWKIFKLQEEINSLKKEGEITEIRPETVEGENETLRLEKKKVKTKWENNQFSNVTS